MKKTGLELLREPFPLNQISKLPKPTKKQTEDVRNDFKKGVRCELCGAWHHPDVVHLDYVGHAALTDRLLDADINWTWEPMALKEGLPAFDSNGGLWIKLTVCGQTRLGYGSATDNENKDNGAYEKEVIGDALRNAAMRFGAALELWHKGDLHVEPPKNPHAPSNMQPSDEEAGNGFIAIDGQYRLPYGSHKGRTIQQMAEIIGIPKLSETITKHEDRVKENKPYAGCTIDQMLTFINEASDFVIRFENQGTDFNQTNFK